MRTVVRFRSGDGEYAVPVEQTREVRSAGALIPLPGAHDGVAGLLRRGDETSTVLSVLGEAGDQVVMLDAGGTGFGLLVEEVTGVVRVEEADIGPPPAGQDSGMVVGVIRSPAALMLLLDVDILAGHLESGGHPG